jgi:tRNA threonylcarbamoyladenosine biosynthesis protein TsaB
MILALETGSDLASIALLDGLQVAAEHAFRHQMSLSRDLMPRVDALLVQAGVGWGAIEAVAVGLGPGSYTGLRIGVVTAKALAWASGRPLLGISSLTALVAPHLAPPETLLCAVLEARAGEFFTALYQRRDGELQIRAQPTVLRVEELSQRLSAYPGPVLVAGHAARCAQAFALASAGGAPASVPELETTIGGSPAPPAPARELWSPATALAFGEFDEEPQARWVGRLAAGRLQAGERDDPLALAPLYVRAPTPTMKRPA